MTIRHGGGGCSKHASGLLLLMWAGQTEIAPPRSPLSDSRRVCERPRPWDGANLGSLLRTDPHHALQRPKGRNKTRELSQEISGRRGRGSCQKRAEPPQQGGAGPLPWRGRGLQVSGRGVHSRMGRGLYVEKGLYTRERAQSWRPGLGQKAKEPQVFEER